MHIANSTFCQLCACVRWLFRSA